jgi:hypothetical protein|tara:strand:+ start:1100 stop:2062 length:963 start_codon:yes stop_codon:yes gene_type:complete
MSVLLAAQVLLVAGLMTRDALSGTSTAPDFVSFDPVIVDGLSVVAGEDSVRLTRDGEAWRLDDAYPADNARIGEVLEKLAGLSAPWPVATSADTAVRFEVADDNFQRRLTLSSDDEVLADILLGTSPGYRRVHARRSGTDEVYSVNLSNHELPADAGQWLDKGLLASTGDVTKLSREGEWTLAAAEGGWLIDTDSADDEAADKLVGRFEDLRVLDIAAPEGEWEAKSVFTVTDDRGDYRVAVFHDAQEDDYSFESERLEGRFTVATYVAEQMIVDRDTLLGTVNEGESADDTKGSNAGEEGIDADLLLDLADDLLVPDAS